MNIFLLDTGFSRCNSDPNVYTKKTGNHLIIRVFYVDDLILTGSDPKLITHVKSSLKQNFEMSDLGQNRGVHGKEHTQLGKTTVQD